MKKYATGFIGCGNMASAIINGILKHHILEPEDIFIYDKDPQKEPEFLGTHHCRSIEELALLSEVIFLCVKPNVIPEVLKEIRADKKAIVSIAAGIKTDRLSKALPPATRIMRIMPNTPLMAGKGASCIQIPNTFSEDENQFIYRIFSELGIVRECREDQMDAVTGVSGSGPAYVYLLIDALARAGEANGLSYQTALDLAVQTFEGGCAMLKTSPKEPGQLIRDVCSPGGTTLEAMKIFEAEDARGMMQKAVDACVRRSKELSE